MADLRSQIEAEVKEKLKKEEQKGSDKSLSKADAEVKRIATKATEDKVTAPAPKKEKHAG